MGQHWSPPVLLNISNFSRHGTDCTQNLLKSPIGLFPTVRQRQAIEGFLAPALLHLLFFLRFLFLWTYLPFPAFPSWKYCPSYLMCILLKGADHMASNKSNNRSATRTLKGQPTHIPEIYIGLVYINRMKPLLTYYSYSFGLKFS